MASKPDHHIHKLATNTDSLSSPPQAPKQSRKKALWPAVRNVLRSSPSRNVSVANIQVPDYCEDHVSIHSSFSDEESLAKLLAMIEHKDSELQDYLDASEARTTLEESVELNEGRDSFPFSSLNEPKKTPEDLRHFQDFVSSFISFFLRSKFTHSRRGLSPDIDPHDLIKTLATNRSCPSLRLFRRVAIDPNLIAATLPDEESCGYAENGVAVSQLARFMDISVLHFLSTINEHTDTTSILWALDYLMNLLHSLISSMNTLNSFGWYGAPHIRIRKATFMGGRKSMSYPLQPPMILNPPPVVVVMGTPPGTPPVLSPIHAGTSLGMAADGARDPVTGQIPIHHQHPSLQVQSPLAHETRGGSHLSTHQISIPNRLGESPSSSWEGDGGEAASSGREEITTTSKQRRNSRPELHGILKTSSDPSAPSPPRSPRSLPHSPSSGSPSSSSQHHHHHHNPASPSKRTRKVTPHSSGGVHPRAVFGSSPPSMQSSGRLSSPPPQQGFGSMESIREEGNEVLEDGGVPGMDLEPLPGSSERLDGESLSSEHEEKGLVQMDPVERSYFENVCEELEMTPPPPPPPPSLNIHPTSPPLDVPSTSPGHQDHHPHHRHHRQVSPLHSVSPAPVLDSILEENLNQGASNAIVPDHNGRSLTSPPLRSYSPPVVDSERCGLRAMSFSPPPSPVGIPDVNIDLELETLINGEGRISLIAILHAIAKFPQSKDIWTEEVGQKCFSLIQLCMDVGLPPQKDDTLPKKKPAPYERRKKLVRQDNIACSTTKGPGAGAPPVEERAWKVHSKHVVEFSVNALIQCGTSSIVGCSADVNFCRLKQFSLASVKGYSVHGKLVHNMRRIQLHSPAIFRQALVKFAHPSFSSCRKLFHFLHVFLQYCVHSIQEVHFNQLLASTVSAVLGVVVDRMVALDITEPSIQETIVKEMCDFISYSNQLFSQDNVPKISNIQHLRMYIHRIALSVILPPRPAAETRPTEPLYPALALPKRGTAAVVEHKSIKRDPTNDEIVDEVQAEQPSPKPSRRIISKNKTLTSVPSSFSPFLGRARSSSLRQTSSSSSSSGTFASETPPSKGGGGTRGGKFPLLKQPTLSDAAREDGHVGGGARGSIPEEKEEDLNEWRGLRIDVLKSRIRRLVVLMNLSEPGTIPDAGMLASLIDLCDGTTVVARSMVFLECAVFVRNLSSQNLAEPTIWVQNNMESPRMHAVTTNLRKWAEAIGEKLRLTELKEKEMYERLQNLSQETDGVDGGGSGGSNGGGGGGGSGSMGGGGGSGGSNGGGGGGGGGGSRGGGGGGSGGGGGTSLPEEPVFPDEVKDERGEKVGFSMSYALKMAACHLLFEITKFLRDIPHHFSPATSISQAGTPLIPNSNNHTLDRASNRRESNVSMGSSDMESSTHQNTCGQATEFKMPHIGHFGSSLSVEDAEHPEFMKSISVDDGSLTCPRRKRASVYLQVSASKPPSGTLSRNTSFRKQARMVRLAESPGESRTLNRSVLSSSPSIRNRRKSISTAGTQQRSRRPSVSFLSSTHTFHSGSGSQIPTSGTYHPPAARNRRKSLGTVHFQHTEIDVTPRTPSSAYPSHSFSGNKPPPGGVGGATSLGTSLNIGFTKLKRSAQRAFRRHGSKSRSSSEVISPNNSPSPSQRKRIHRPSVSESYSQKSVFFPSVPEESWRYYPWLDVVEHLILVDASNKNASSKNRCTCQKLIAALKKIYSSEDAKSDSEEGDKASGNKGAVASEMKHSASSLGSLFIHRLTLHDTLEPAVVDRKSANPYGRWLSAPGGESTAANRGSTIRPSIAARSISIPIYPEKSRQSSPLRKLNFANVHYTNHINSYLSGTTSASDMKKDETIQLAIEDASPFEKKFLSSQSDKERRQYIDQDYSGLMHTLFSVMVYATPILHSRSFSILKGLAWDSLLRTDSELSQAAGAFFLLVAAKESDRAMKGFVTAKIMNQEELEKRDAVLRFKVLWDCRYRVWPRMEERAQKKLNFNTDRENKKETIGYSLLANLLGHPGEDLPISPCDPVSVCTSKTCQVNPEKCYRPTRHAPVLHATDISDKVHGYSVSGVSIAQETGVKSNLVVYHGFESEDALGPREWEAVDSTLFPNSLLPLIKFLLSSLIPGSSPSPTPSSSSDPFEYPHQSQLDRNELARQVVWACMVEEPRLFFRPLLNQFNKIYMLISDKKNKSSNKEHLMTSFLKLFHIVLQVFPKLPSRAAHVLLNNFVGVVLQHTDQPCSLSGKITQSILTLIAMVAPSVQGLDSKLLKSFLKKESCYTTIMTTARIRGVERVILESDHYEPRNYKITDDMTFGHLISEACRDDELTPEFLNNWYLVDQSKEIPLLSSLVIQDHYSVPVDSQHPTFVLRKADNVWSHRMDQLFVFKMSEIMRVLFTTRLLLTGPDLEKGFTYSEFSVPNYRFIHNELVELSSFPRKALTSVLYEAGPSALKHSQLRASDIMLKGMWVRFVLQLITSASRDYDWSNSMLLFINVVNGALLLHSEDYSILYYSLVTVLTTVTKYNSIFKKDGYLMVIPTLLQVYSLNLKNSLITNAIKFIWTRFYMLNKNDFVSQLMASSSTLLSEEAASLSCNFNSNIVVDSRKSANMEAEEAKTLVMRALFELITSLTPGGAKMGDEMNILHACYQHLDPDLYSSLTADDSRSSLSLKEAVTLSVTLASWNPEAIRGMQVIVFLDYSIPSFLPALGTEGLKFITEVIQFLIKECESLSKPQTWRGDILHTRRGGGGGDTASSKTDEKKEPLHQGLEEDPVEEAKTTSRRKVSVARAVSKILYNPNKKDSLTINSNEGGDPNLTTTTFNLGHLDHTTYHNQFKLRRIQNSDHRVLQLSRNSLLSVVSEFCLYFSRANRLTTVRKYSAPVLRKQSLAPLSSHAGSASANSKLTNRVVLDPQSVLVLTSIASQVIKQGVHNETILQGKGLTSFFSHILPNLDWTDAHFSSFSSLLSRLFRLFKQLQRSSNKAILVWDCLTNFITGLTLCIHHNPQLVLGQDQHVSKLKILLEAIMSLGRGDPQATTNLHKNRSINVPLLEISPHSFSEAVISLAVELIIITNTLQNQQRSQTRFTYHISDFITLKSLKDFKDTVVPKILLPLCIQLGFRSDVDAVSLEDVEFVLKFVYSRVEYSSKFPHQKHLPEQIFRVLKIVCCAFKNTLTLHHWNQIAQSILSLFNKKLSFRKPNKKTSITSITNADSGSGPLERRRANRLSSVSDANSTPLESFINFHSNLLSFFESFLMVYRVPLQSLLSPLLWKLEPLLQLAKQDVKVDNPAQLEKVSSIIERCHRLQKTGLKIHSVKGKQILLKEMLDDVKLHSQIPGRTTLSRSRTTVEDKKRGTAKKLPRLRRNSVTLSKIKEESEHNKVSFTSSSSLPRDATFRVENRPKTLNLYRSESSAATSSAAPQKSSNQGKQFVLSSLPKKKTASKPGLSTIEGSPRRLKKKSPDVRRRHVEIADSPDGSPVLPIRRRRSPKPPRVKMDPGGDVDDAISPESSVVITNSSPTFLTAQEIFSPKKEEDNVVITNTSNSSPFQARKKSSPSFEEGARNNFARQTTVPVEVHINDEVAENIEGEFRSIQPMDPTLSQDKEQQEMDMLNTLELDMSSSTDTNLLPLLGNSSEHTRRKRPKSPIFNVRNRLSLSQPNVQGDERDLLIELHGGGSPYFAWEGKPTDDNVRTEAYSLDRPRGDKFLASAQKEANRFLYRDLKSHSESEKR